MSERTVQDTKWILPSSRKEYIIHNPATQTAMLYSNQAMIAPVWTKMSKTPWQDSALLCGGYGRQLQNTSISNDAPAYFLNPDRVAFENRHNPNNNPPLPARTKTREFVNKNKNIEGAHVLPGGLSILAATQSRAQTAALEKVHEKRSIAVPYGKQTFKMEMPANHRAFDHSTFAKNSSRRTPATQSTFTLAPPQPIVSKINSHRSTARSSARSNFAPDSIRSNFTTENY